MKKGGDIDDKAYSLSNVVRQNLSSPNPCSRVRELGESMELVDSESKQYANGTSLLVYPERVGLFASKTGGIKSKIWNAETIANCVLSK